MQIKLTQLQAEVMLDKIIAQKLDLAYVEVSIENIPDAKEVFDLKETVTTLKDQISTLESQVRYLKNQEKI